ncbi:hypothetical protein AAEO56_16725 [Flavobacterium sp. DGU11]|uniref:Uncharacterized protein n=1 Tax=Flavobacterium arundinis TaxID=3139143 RepID=A0ABU9I121_9FLAO
MKRFLAFFAITAGFICHAQVPDRLAVAVPNSGSNSSTLNTAPPDFTFYSKNYNKVFDYYQYTFDAQKLSQRSVYVGSGNRFYFGQNGGFIMDMGQPSPNAYRINSGYAYDVIGLVRGINLIATSGKDYSVKLKPEVKDVQVFKGDQ